MYKYIKKNAHNSTQNDKKNNKFSLQDTTDTLSSGTYTATRRPFSRSSFPQVCKEALFALKRSLVCTKKKPCLQHKEALFGMQRSLVCKPGKHCRNRAYTKWRKNRETVHPILPPFLSATVPRTPTCRKQNAIRRRARSRQTDCRISAFLPATCLSSTIPAESPSAPYIPPCS